MKVIRAVIWTTIVATLLLGIGTSLNLMTHPHPPKPQTVAWERDDRTLWTDLDERSHLKRVSRAGSRSVVVSVPTSITTDSISQDQTKKPTPKPKPPKPTTTVPNTAPPTSAENPEGEISSSNYDICLAAAASVKGNKIAPNVARWVGLVEKYFSNEISKTCRVMACESGGNPGAVGPRQPNGTYPQGLMQILAGPFDPEENMALAASMRAKRGWQPWACK